MSPQELHPLAGLLAALACAVGGLLVPALVRRIPEPDPAGRAGRSAGEDADPAGRAGRSAGDNRVETPAPTQGDDHEDEPPEEPKELYADIAARPGLAWRSAATAGVAGGLLGLVLGPSWPLLYLLPLVPVSVALAVVDWRTRLLPTKVIAPTYAGTVVLVLVCWLATGDTDDLVRAGWGWLVAGGLFFALWFVHPRGLGYGDVRLSGVLGIALGYLGWGPLLVGVYVGFLLGGLGGGLLSLLRLVERRAFPFGPFMLVGALVGALWGGSVLRGLVGG